VILKFKSSTFAAKVPAGFSPGVFLFAQVKVPGHYHELFTNFGEFSKKVA